jgi:hypothetical protein
MTDRKITYIEVAGRQIAAVHCICPVCNTLDLGTSFTPNKTLDGLVAICPNGHEWEIPKEN